MDLKNIRHLREILIADTQGKLIGVMQYSSQSTYHFRPSFVDVPSADQERARELYLKWGGQRRDGIMFGMVITIPILAGLSNHNGLLH